MLQTLNKSHRSKYLCLKIQSKECSLQLKHTAPFVAVAYTNIVIIIIIIHISCFHTQKLCGDYQVVVFTPC